MPQSSSEQSEKIKGLSDLLQDIGRNPSHLVLSGWQEKSLISLLEGWHDTLTALGRVIQENYYLNPSNVHGDRENLRRVWKRLKWEPDDIQELRSRVACNIGLLNAFNGSFLSNFTSEIRTEVGHLHERQDKQERLAEDQAILDWLTPIDHVLQQGDFMSRRQPGTGQWLLDSAEFKLWMEKVINELTTRFSNDLDFGVAYVYCNFRRHDEQRVEDMLLCFLRQLIQDHPSIPDSTKVLYKQHSTKRTHPSLKEISLTLQSVIASYSMVFLVIDALDECQDSHRCRSNLLAEVFDFQAGYDINAFATSRPNIPEILDRFDSSIRLEIRASREDVHRYLDGHLSPQRAFLRNNLALQEETKVKIVEAVDGMCVILTAHLSNHARFLLAQLLLDSLQAKTPPRDLRSALEKLPTGPNAYDEAYEDAMERISSQGEDGDRLAKQVLSWITCVDCRYPHFP